MFIKIKKKNVHTINSNRNWNLPQCSPKVRWINTLRYINIMEYCIAMDVNELTSTPIERSYLTNNI